MAILNFSDVLMKVGLDPKNVKLIRHMRDYIPAIASMALCLMRRMYARLDCLRVRQKSIVARWHFMIWNMWTC